MIFNYSQGEAKHALTDALEDQVDRDGQVEVRGRLVEDARERGDGGEVDVGYKRKVFSGRVRVRISSRKP